LLIEKRDVLEKPSDPDGLILEAWAQGYMVGSLVIMAFMTMANMRRGVLLHKLILLELILGLWQGFWLFFDKPVFSWWLSVGAIFLNASWSLHNVISWMKIKPFLSPTMSKIFIITVILAQPYWVLEIYANFAYFHGVNKLFERTRPWESLCRDPWWIFTTVVLLWTIRAQYDLKAKEIVKISPRFGIMIAAMFLSIIFIVLDILSVTKTFDTSLPVGINPFWKLSFVFKCLTDMVVLDDFKTALDRLRAFKLSRMGSYIPTDSDIRNNGEDFYKKWQERAAGQSQNSGGAFHSPEGELVNSGYFPDARRSSSRPPKASDDDLSKHKDSLVAPDDTSQPGPSSSHSQSRRDENASGAMQPETYATDMEPVHTRSSASDDIDLYDMLRYTGPEDNHGPNPDTPGPSHPRRHLGVRFSMSKRRD